MTTFAALVLGTIASFAIEWLKVWSRKSGVPVKGKDGLLLLALVAGGSYAAFFYIVPKELQTSIVEYMGTSIATAMLVYEFLLKNESRTQ
jgi:hypothetical protein